MAGAERRTVVAAYCLATAMGCTAVAAVVLSSLGGRVSGTRSGVQARLRWSASGVGERRELGRRDLAAGRPAAARDRLTAALRREPFSAPLWLERGEAALQAGDLRGVRQSAAAAIRRAPVDAGVCYRAALLLLQAGARDRAAEALRCAATHAPDHVMDVYDLADAVYDDDGLVLRTIVPPDPDDVRRFLGWAYARDLSGAAAAGWGALVAGGASRADVIRHVDFLLGRGDVEAAEARWTETFGPRGDNLIVDGGFEGEPLGAAFGWRLGSTAGAHVQVAGGEAAAEGRRGLAIEFTGGNVDFAHAAQIVPVAGERRYRLTARLRSAGLTSLAGPRLQVEPYPPCAGLAPVATPEIRGTQPWKEFALDFATPAGCAAVRVIVRRPATTRLDRELRGRLWLDDVRLIDAGPAV